MLIINIRIINSLDCELIARKAKKIRFLDWIFSELFLRSFEYLSWRVKEVKLNIIKAVRWIEKMDGSDHLFRAYKSAKRVI